MDIDIKELNQLKSLSSKKVSKDIDEMVNILSAIRDASQKIHTGNSIILKKDLMPIWELFIVARSKIDHTLSEDLHSLFVCAEGYRRKYGY